jgi:peptidoglycan/LPS O-acetylase OafA/YrhL
MKLSSIQYLRGVAATSVVVTHASTSLFRRESALIPFQTGAGGVDLFFVISGFIMFYTTADNGIGPRDFYIRRLIRIWPLYIILTSFAFLIVSVSPLAFNTLSPDPSEYIRSILFIPYYNSKTHVIQPEIGQGWTLNYEMFFYLIFGLSLFFRRSIRLPLCAAVFAILALVGLVVSNAGPAITTYTDSIALEFIFGMVIAYCMMESVRAFRRLVVSLVCATVTIGVVYWFLSYAGVSDVHVPRFALAGIPSAAIIAAALWIERAGRLPEIPLLVLIGDASYSLYLSHGFVLGALRRIWERIFDINLFVTHAGFMAIGTAAAIAASLLLYAWLESPLTSWLMRRTRHLRLHVRKG